MKILIEKARGGDPSFKILKFSKEEALRLITCLSKQLAFDETTNPQNRSLYRLEDGLGINPFAVEEINDSDKILLVAIVK